MIGIQIEENIKPLDVEIKCLQEGLCVATAGSDVVRFLPPLTISKKEIDKGLSIFYKVLKTYC